MKDKYSLVARIPVRGGDKEKTPIYLKIAYMCIGIIVALTLFQVLMEGVSAIFDSLRIIAIPLILIVLFRKRNNSIYKPFAMDIEFYEDHLKILLPAVEEYVGQGLHSEVIEIIYSGVDIIEYNTRQVSTRITGKMRKTIYRNPNSFNDIVYQDTGMDDHQYYINMEPKDKEALLHILQAHIGKEIVYLN